MWTIVCIYGKPKNQKRSFISKLKVKKLKNFEFWLDWIVKPVINQINKIIRS